MTTLQLQAKLWGDFLMRIHKESLLDTTPSLLCRMVMGLPKPDHERLSPPGYWKTLKLWYESPERKISMALDFEFLKNATLEVLKEQAADMEADLKKEILPYLDVMASDAVNYAQRKAQGDAGADVYLSHIKVQGEMISAMLLSYGYNKGVEALSQVAQIAGKILREILLGMMGV